MLLKRKERRGRDRVLIRGEGSVVIQVFRRSKFLIVIFRIGKLRNLKTLNLALSAILSSSGVAMPI